MKLFREIGKKWTTWARGVAWGALLYLLAMMAILFIYSQQQSTFIYAGF